MANSCASCGHENAAEARFCNQCGQALESAPTGSEAERRYITVFFSDLSGYTAMSEQLDPEVVQRIMTRIFETARDIVDKYGGRIEKLLGDAVMAVFGDPVVHEDDAERAVRAVLELHAAVEELSPAVEPKIGRPIAMHTGINTGLVITSGAEFDNAVGDAINVAARLEDLSEPGEILLGPETAHAVAGVFSVEDHGSRALKGKSGPVPVTRVLGLASTRVEPSRKHGGFVGRHEEMGGLLAAVERMRDGESSVVSLRAEAGTGKTRLLAEFRGRLPDEVQWLEGRAYAYGENIPYAAVIDLLRRSIGIDEDDVPKVIETKLRAAVADLVGEVDVVYAPLARLFGLPLPEGVVLDRETYRRRLLDAVLAMTEALACRAPTVLAFQDLHWADPSTVHLIRDLIDRLETPVVVVANYRPEFSFGANGERVLDLAELSPRQTQALLTSLLDDRPPPDGLAEFIVSRTDGNPFFVEEIINSLLETDVLRVDGDGWNLVGGLDGVNLPTSIRGVIAARIDRLDERRRRVLREASVVGREFLYDVVAQVTTLTDELDPSLEDLQAADLIREKTPDPELEYFFKHALTQDVAYDGLLKVEREELHGRAAAAIEAQFAGRLEEVTETLAYHWSHSGNTDKAVEYLTAAGRKAMERFALQESEAHYERAYDMLAGLPEGDDRSCGIVALLLEWAFLAYYQARLHDLRRYLIEHQGAVDRVGDAEQQGMWMAWLGHASFAADGDYRHAMTLLDQALELGRRVDNTRVIAYAQAWRVFALWWLGRVDEAILAGREAQRLSAGLPSEPYVWFKSTCGVGLALVSQGDFVAARAIADELIASGERTGSARSKAMAVMVLAQLAYLTGDEPASAAAIRLSSESAGDPIYEHGPAASRLFALVLDGAAGEARRYHDDQYQRFVIGRHVRLLARFLELGDGVLLALEGRPGEGFAKVEAVAEAAAASGELLHEHYAYAVLALMYAEVAMTDAGVGDLVRNPRFAFGRGKRARKEAVSRLDDVLAHLDEWGIGGLRFNLEHAYARLLAHQGDGEGAGEHLKRAIAAVESAGDTAGFRAARRMLSDLGG
jgi:class 3 adenylate cyclase/tetratricopeptide (TPR) repeat protein